MSFAKTTKTLKSLSKTIEAFTSAWEEFWGEAAEIIYRWHKAMEAPKLIPQYENEIKKVKQLLKYTKHSKKRQKHERRLKWLQAELASLYEVVGKNEQTRA